MPFSTFERAFFERMIFKLWRELKLPETEGNSQKDLQPGLLNMKLRLEISVCIDTANACSCVVFPRSYGANAAVKAAFTMI